VTVGRAPTLANSGGLTCYLDDGYLSTSTTWSSSSGPSSAPNSACPPPGLDIGTCLGGPVSLDYHDRAPFPLNGTIDTVNVRYTS